jgi:hypothetical protein
VVSFAVASAVEGDYLLRVLGPGIDETVTLSESQRTLSYQVRLTDASAELRLSTDAPPLASTDPRDLRFRVVNPTVEVYRPQ